MQCVLQLAVMDVFQVVTTAAVRRSSNRSAFLDAAAEALGQIPVVLSGAMLERHWSTWYCLAWQLSPSQSLLALDAACAHPQNL